MRRSVNIKSIVPEFIFLSPFKQSMCFIILTFIKKEDVMYYKNIAFRISLLNFGCANKCFLTSKRVILLSFEISQQNS